MAKTQMNIRFDDALKNDGTAAFARCGYTPTQVVHAVWSFACRNAGSTETIRAMMDAISDTTPGARQFFSSSSIVKEGTQESNASKKSEKLRTQRRTMLGISGKAPSAKDLDEATYEKALQDQIESDNALRATMMLHDLQEGAQS